MLLAAGLGGAAPASAHYVHIEKQLVKPGTFTVGMIPSGAPFSFRVDGAMRGFEVDVAQAVADSHGLALRVVPLASDALLPALARGEVDAINTLPLARPGADIAVVPFILEGDYMMVLRGNPYQVHGPDDLAGQTVAATAGSPAEAYADAINRRLVARGLAPMAIHSFAYQRDTSFPVDMGHAAAYFIQSVSAVGITLDPASRTRLLPGSFHLVREAGFGVRRDHWRISHGIQHAVAAMVATGRYQRLLEKYHLPGGLSPFKRE